MAHRVDSPIRSIAVAFQGIDHRPAERRHLCRRISAALVCLFAILASMSPPIVPDDNREPSKAQWRQWGRWVLFVVSIIVVVLILMGVRATKPWFWGLF